MALFSQRKGLKPLEKEIQLKSLDEETRYRVWTVLTKCVWEKWSEHALAYDQRAIDVQRLLDRLWFNYFKRPSDAQPPLYREYDGGRPSAYDFMRDYVLRHDWNEVFDFLEFCVSNLTYSMREEVIQALNLVLTEENVGYRVVGEQFAEITNEVEIQEVETAMAAGLEGVLLHMKAATSFLFDRKNPNYRNSIKESISAVESLFKVLTGKKSATLSDGLKEVRASFDVHPALITGFEKIYAYTSDEQGIRHALIDSDKTTFSDAKFMLVSCSAFINYVIGKYAEAGKKLK